MFQDGVVPKGGRLELPAILAISLLVQTTISLLAACIPVIAPKIAESRGWNIDLIAFYSPILYGVAFLTSFIAPRFVQRLGGMGLSLVCIAFGVVGLLFILPASMILNIAAPVAIGLATGAMNPASSQVLGPRTTPATAGTIMSIKQTGVPMGAMLAGILVPVLAETFGWHAAILYLAGASTLVLISLSPSIRWLNGGPNARPIRSYRPLEPVRRLLAIPGMWAILAAGAVFSSMLVCLRTFYIVYLVKDVHLGLATAGFALGASQAAGMIGQIAWAAVSDRLFPAHLTMGIIGIVMTVSALLSASFVSSWSVSAIILVSIAFGFSAAGFVPVVLGEISRRTDAPEIGAMTAGANLFLLGGVIFGPMLFGIIASNVSYSLAFAAMAAISLFISMVAIVVGRRTTIGAAVR